MNNRDLTPEEIDSLSTELKACFTLQGWNISAEIKNVSDWINSFWRFWVDSDIPENAQEEIARKSMWLRWNEIHEYLVLKETLAEVMSWIKNWSPEFTDDPEWKQTETKVKKVLYGNETI